jgi:hypothetical protein
MKFTEAKLKQAFIETLDSSNPYKKPPTIAG